MPNIFPSYASSQDTQWAHFERKKFLKNKRKKLFKKKKEIERSPMGLRHIRHRKPNQTTEPGSQQTQPTINNRPIPPYHVMLASCAGPTRSLPRRAGGKPTGHRSRRLLRRSYPPSTLHLPLSPTALRSPDRWLRPPAASLIRPTLGPGCTKVPVFFFFFACV